MRKKKGRTYKVECLKCGRRLDIYRISGDNTKSFYCPDCQKMVKPKEISNAKT